MTLDPAVPIVLDFWRQNCAPCAKIAPALADLANKYRGKIQVIKAEAASNESALAAFKVEAFPTLVVIKNGQEVDRQVGSLRYDELEQFITRNIPT